MTKNTGNDKNKFEYTEDAEIQTEEEAKEIQQEKEVRYTDVTFCPVWNETEKRYDMLKLFVDGPTETVVKIEREPTRYDTKVRAMHHVISLVTQEFIRK